MPPKKTDLPSGFEENPPYNFSPNNGITLTVGMLGTCVTALVAGAISIVSFGFYWSAKIDKMSEQITELTSVVWTMPDAREMFHRLRRDNPTMILSDPTEIHRTIREKP